jgi:hypothetical protein
MRHIDEVASRRTKLRFVDDNIKTRRGGFKKKKKKEKKGLGERCFVAGRIWYIDDVEATTSG